MGDFCIAATCETLTPTNGIICSALGGAVKRHLLWLRLTSVRSSRRLSTRGSTVANVQISQDNSRDLPSYCRARPLLQLNKCVFCERQFESPLYGTIEFDLEHFRPKSNVPAWPDPRRHSALNYTVAMGDASEQGYFWLAYDPLSYAVSCKVCNSIFKSNYFPIAGARGPVESSVADLTIERPYLCYPLGTQAEDLEALITFKATVAVPTQTAGPDRLRGQIIIDFFGLNARE